MTILSISQRQNSLFTHFHNLRLSFLPKWNCEANLSSRLELCHVCALLTAYFVGLCGSTGVARNVCRVPDEL